mmetsp:Transcript_109036/g.315009  ORF Transcript_109036/g.315009 Transcript_109036/m.315009 type:complete len:206 (+) Transcript_109036:791-1408(+)
MPWAFSDAASVGCTSTDGWRYNLSSRSSLPISSSNAAALPQRPLTYTIRSPTQICTSLVDRDLTFQSAIRPLAVTSLMSSVLPSLWSTATPREQPGCGRRKCTVNNSDSSQSNSPCDIRYLVNSNWSLTSSTVSPLLFAALIQPTCGVNPGRSMATFSRSDSGTCGCHWTTFESCTVTSDPRWSLAINGLSSSREARKVVLASVR